MIHNGASELDLEQHARTNTGGIRDDGREKILDGSTSVDEVMHVTMED